MTSLGTFSHQTMVPKKAGTTCYLLNSSHHTFPVLSQGTWRALHRSRKLAISSYPVLFRLQKLARLARPARTRMMQRDFPEDWVHDSGRLVVVGSAAHPFPVCAFRLAFMRFWWPF